jgi:hypothetical protein
MPSLADHSPVEIDTELYRLWTETARLSARYDSTADYLRRVRAGERHYVVYDGGAALEAELAEYRTQIAALRAEAMPLEAEYARRQWNRYFLVTNSNGHVHRGMMCQTCFATTEYAWLVDLAGCDEAAMVVEYGEKACTVCFPDAPAHPSFAGPGRRDREAVQARQAEKAARDAVKAAKLLEAPLDLGDEWGGRFGDRIETVAAAKQALREAASDLVWSPKMLAQVAEFRTADEMVAERTRYANRDAKLAERIPVLRAALAAKGLTAAELDTIIERAEKKARKEAGI